MFYLNPSYYLKFVKMRQDFNLLPLHIYLQILCVIYSELLGMKDTISEEDLLIDTTKTEIEKRLSETEKKNTILNDKLDFLETKLSEIGKLTDVLFEQIAKRN